MMAELPIIFDTESIRAIYAAGIQEYLRSRGWALQADLSAQHGVVVYENQANVVEISTRPDFADYGRRMLEVVELLAELEGLDEVALLDEIARPQHLQDHRGAVTREEAITRLRAVVDADDALEAVKALRAGGTIVHGSHMRHHYASRERADREAWGTCADDRATFARELLALLTAGEPLPRVHEPPSGDQETKGATPP